MLFALLAATLFMTPVQDEPAFDDAEVVLLDTLYALTACRTLDDFLAGTDAAPDPRQAARQSLYGTVLGDLTRQAVAAGVADEPVMEQSLRDIADTAAARLAAKQEDAAAQGAGERFREALRQQQTACSTSLVDAIQDPDRP